MTGQRGLGLCGPRRVDGPPGGASKLALLFLIEHAGSRIYVARRSGDDATGDQLLHILAPFFLVRPVYAEVSEV